ALWTAHLQRLKHKCRDIEVAQAAPVGDLLELHEARARGAPGLVGLGLLARHPFEIRRPALGPSRLVSALETWCNNGWCSSGTRRSVETGGEDDEDNGPGPQATKASE